MSNKLNNDFGVFPRNFGQPVMELVIVGENVEGQKIKSTYDFSRCIC